MSFFVSDQTQGWINFRLLGKECSQLILILLVFSFKGDGVKRNGTRQRINLDIARKRERIDVLRMKARYFEGEDERVEEIPEDYLDVAQVARDKLCDLVAEADEDLMIKYLDGEEQLTQEELEQLLDKAIAQEIFIPVFVGSTIIKQGIKGLMEDIASVSPRKSG